MVRERCRALKPLDSETVAPRARFDQHRKPQRTHLGMAGCTPRAQHGRRMRQRALAQKLRQFPLIERRLKIVRCRNRDARQCEALARVREEAHSRLCGAQAQVRAESACNGGTLQLSAWILYAVPDLKRLDEARESQRGAG